jgi:hypothetical protein
MGLNQKAIHWLTSGEAGGADLHQEFNREVRSHVFQSVIGTVRQRLFDPSLNGKDWIGWGQFL